MTTVAYIANEFPSPLEPYVMDEINELRRHGAQVVCCSGKRVSPNRLNLAERAFWKETLYFQPLTDGQLTQAAGRLASDRRNLCRILRPLLWERGASASLRIRALGHTLMGAALAEQLESRGVEHIHVQALENDSGDPELGAAATAALRDELARRGASAGADAPAQLEGTVRVTPGVNSTLSYYNWAPNVGVEIHARLSLEGKLLHEVTIQQLESHPGGADPLESEGRRSATLRKLARDAAREVIREMEEPPAAASGKT